MKKLMMVMSVALLALGASAATEDVDGVTWSYEVSNGEASVYRGFMTPAIPDSTAGAIAIPATLGGYPVTSIESYAFSGCSGLATITIPSSVTSIGSAAFYNCSGLTSVTIPMSVTSIGSSAFSGCSGLTLVSIPEGVTSIESYAFHGCSGLTSVRIPAAVARIGSAAFSGCSGLTSVTIPQGVTSIWPEAFSGCSGLTTVTIPEGVTSVGSGVFYNCSGLVSVTIPVGVTSIGDWAFSGCSELTSVMIPEGVTSIGDDTFFCCSRLTSVTIPSSMTSIGDRAFYGCSGLTSVTIPPCVTSFGFEAFSGCSGLTSVTIPEGVTFIRDYAFYGCSGLKSVTIPEGVMGIGGRAFSGCSGLTSVTIPESVTRIGDYAFYSCSGLKTVTIHEGVTEIGFSAFEDCSGLKSLTIPSSVTGLGSSAFSGCSGLKVEFLGPPPSGSYSSLLSSGRAVFPREYGAQWMAIRGINSFSGYGQGGKPVVEIVSAAIRENDPTVMDVVYKVMCANPTVKVRALAFQDGERSFAKVVRPTEFIEDTAKNIGDAIAANEEHKLSWRMSADWKVDLAKVKFEVLASDGDLLPLELTTIPKTANHAAMEISWNAIAGQQVFDALLWMYADGDEGLTIANGVLKNGTTQLANGTSLSTTAAARYVFSKMGFSLLSGDELKYANEMTRLGLSPSGARQYAWREVND